MWSRLVESELVVPGNLQERLPILYLAPRAQGFRIGTFVRMVEKKKKKIYLGGTTAFWNHHEVGQRGNREIMI